METKIDVRNLSISFYTNSGTVKAVRDISFSVEKGETLAIVGESGSGKSVTAKAVLGILAKNSIVEGGEIIYDGQDLLKISEDEFNELRGHKISMIYQDPLSSLDPIMKIGKQMTEATLINGKVSRKHGKKNFTDKLHELNAAIKAAGTESSKADGITNALSAAIEKGSAEAVAYNRAREYAESALFSCEQLMTAVKKADSKLIGEETGWLKERLDAAKNEKLIPASSRIWDEEKKLPDSVESLEKLLKEALSAPQPVFYEISEEAKAETSKALKAQAESNIPKKKAAAEAIEKALPGFRKDKLDESTCKAAAADTKKLVNDAIDRLTVIKDSGAYTYGSTMSSSLVRYFKGIPKNIKETKRVERDTAKREKLIAKKGDAPEVVPAVIVDLELTRNTMIRSMEEVRDRYLSDIAGFADHDFNSDAERLIEWLEEQAERMVTEVSRKYAYDKAIRIMEDVGIAEPRKRFEQYPFEFSGGMRQRIVIAIAIAANPDILICDEPTTALDVTIQAQILELINDLKAKRNLTVIFITHDLGVVANIADKVAVMYAGKIVEYGTVDDIFYEPAHPYTWALLSSMPDLDTEDRLESIPGTPPNMIYPPKGDAFAARNKYALEIDLERQPPKFRISDTHWAATWLLHPKAPKVEMPAIIRERIDRMRLMDEKEAEA